MYNNYNCMDIMDEVYFHYTYVELRLQMQPQRIEVPHRRPTSSTLI